jgi:hypothetical protein
MKHGLVNGIPPLRISVCCHGCEDELKEITRFELMD